MLLQSHASKDVASVEAIPVGAGCVDFVLVGVLDRTLAIADRTLPKEGGEGAGREGAATALLCGNNGWDCGGGGNFCASGKDSVCCVSVAGVAYSVLMEDEWSRPSIAARRSAMELT